MRVDEVPEMGSAPCKQRPQGPQFQLCTCPSCENTAGTGLPSGREEGSPRTRPASLGLDLAAQPPDVRNTCLPSEPPWLWV